MKIELELFNDEKDIKTTSTFLMNLCIDIGFKKVWQYCERLAKWNKSRILLINLILDSTLLSTNLPPSGLP